jgi:GT2 family glycosyltransferase
VRAGDSRVTTVVATRNRWPDLVMSLPRHGGPVVLVDNGSQDGTPDLVRKRFPHVRVIELGHNRGAVARNIGVQAARTPYVAFSDDDSWWAPTALERAAGHLDRHQRLAVVAASILVGAAARLDPVCHEMAESPLPTPPGLPGRAVLGFVACGTVVRREAYVAAGGFDEVVHFGGEEERLALDVASQGWALAYVDDVVAHHHPSPTRDGQAARQVLLERNRLLTALMRRPWPVVIRTAARSRPGAVTAAVPRVSGAMGRRAVVPASVEQQLRLLEGDVHACA